MKTKEVIMRHFYPEKYERQLAEMEQRRSAYDKRTPEEQIALLNERLGDGVGAIKERASLAFQALYQKGAPADPLEAEAWKKELKVLAMKVWDAKIELRGYRIMRQLGLSERIAAEQLAA